MRWSWPDRRNPREPVGVEHPSSARPLDRAPSVVRQVQQGFSRMPNRPSTERTLRGLCVGGAVLGLLILPGCKEGPFGANDAKASAAEEEEQATPVVTAIVKAGSISATISAASTIEAERQVTVHAESTGRLVKLAVEEGDEVREGKVLGRIKYDAQAAMLDRASTSLERTAADLETVRELYAKRVASKEELDAAELAHRQALLDVRDSKLDIRNTRVTVPFSGTVTERFVNEGSFVSSGAQLFSVVDMSTLVARVYVPEKELDRIRVGQATEIVGKAARGRQGVGFVQRIAPVVDPGTGTVKVTIALPEELVGGERGFMPGMYAEVTLTTAERDRAVLVPKEALIHDDDQAFVFVVDDDRAVRTAVEVGLRDATHAEITSGVALGDEVVATGHAGLKDGGLITRVDPTGTPIEDDDGSSPVAGRADASKPESSTGASSEQQPEGA
jgi:membrane fusion protein, multidrug efflux system